MAQVTVEQLQALMWAADEVHLYLTDTSCGDPDCCTPMSSEEAYTEGLRTLASLGITVEGHEVCAEEPRLSDLALALGNALRETRQTDD